MCLFQAKRNSSAWVLFFNISPFSIHRFERYNCADAGVCQAGLGIVPNTSGAVYIPSGPIVVLITHTANFMQSSSLLVRPNSNLMRSYANRNGA